MKQPSQTLTDPDLLDHIRRLGLEDIPAYQTWCDEHGFSRRLRKHWRLRMRERDYAVRLQSDGRLVRKKAELRRPAEMIARIFRGEVSKSSVTQPFLTAIIRAYESSINHPVRGRSLLSILQVASKHEGLLTTEPVIRDGGIEGNSYIEAIVALARSSDCWIRSPESWKPRTHSNHRQFESLARHLFARWPVPQFMDSAWFKGDSLSARRYQDWFVHLGRGENIRTADLPIPFTKRMAHHFMQAPPDFTIEAALRFGQIRALGGTERLASAVAATRLGRSFDNDDFWLTVLRWFCAYPTLELRQVGPIVDFIQHQRFEGDMPAHPNFSMKGRTPESLLRQVETWHRELARSGQPAAEWSRMDIPDFQFTEGSKETAKVWTIRELLSTKELAAEGRRMQHCVATYARSSVAGSVSIWTMDVESAQEQAKVLTIEVRKSARLIVQARGKWNRMASEKQRGILRRWAAASRLRLATYI